MTSRNAAPITPPALEVDPLADLISVAETLLPPERQRLAADLAVFWQQLRWSRQRRMHRSGARVDGRRTFREFVRHGGVLSHVHFHRRARLKRLVVVVDCSESAVRPGLAMLVDAIRRVDPQIVLLGFDYDVQVLRTTGVLDLEGQWLRRHAQGRRLHRRFLDLSDLSGILGHVARYGPPPSQSYLLLLSDLLLSGNVTPPLESLGLTRRTLLQYRKVWLLDTLPIGPPLREDADGLVSCSGRALRQMCDAAGELPFAFAARLADGATQWQLSPSELERLALLGDQTVLRARRFTPQRRQLGFADCAEPHRDEQLVYLPHSRCVDLSDIFCQALP